MNSVVYLSFIGLMLARALRAYSVFPTDICFSELCYERGMEINKSIHLTSDPCDNFYKFSCNGWIFRTEKPPFELLWDHWNEAAHGINARLREILEHRLPTTQTLRKARFMYLVCLDSERNYLDELILLYRAMGGWPLVGERSKTLERYNWTKKLAEVTRFVNISPLLKFFVDVDYKNASRHIMYIEPGDLVMPSYILEQPENHVDQLIHYKQWMVDTVRYMHPKKLLPKLYEDVDDVIALEIKLATLSANSTSSRMTMKIRDLNVKTNVNWSDVFRVLLESSGVQIGLNDAVVVSYSYLRRLMQLVRKTSKHIIANYMTWHIIQKLSRDVSPYMRYLNFRINNAIFGIEEDYPTQYECVSKVGEYFNFALTAKYAESYMASGSTDYIANMTDKIKNEFLMMLRKNKWFSREALLGAIEKIETVTVLVGFPSWIRNETLVDAFYKDIKITNNHFLNVLHLRKHLARKNFQKLLLPDTDKWPHNLFDVNGYYNQLQNSIIISLGLMEKPFFNADGPSVLNYGALGSLIGHELSHALDSLGGQPRNIGGWTSSDIKEYQSKIACVKQQYDSYDVNGQQTITENIADNVGLELSFRAYRRATRTERNLQIPFLENYSRDQMFFIGYAQMWCELHDGDGSEFLNEGEHAPVQYRVQGVVSNSEHFYKSYACAKVDNDKEKCRLW